MFEENASFENVNGKRVFYILSEPNVSQNKIVIMNHGFRGTSIGPARTFVDFGNILLQNGFSVLRFDQAKSGNSEGNFFESSFNEWVSTTTYFAKKYIDKGLNVALLGQSMGATTTMIATSKVELKDYIPCIILWVPDPKSTFDKSAEIAYEEGGQKYKGTFWQEARNANFFESLEKYNGVIHLVFGEEDKFISKELRNQVIDKVKKKNNKNNKTMILKGQDHSSWEFDASQLVYKEELEFLKKNL